MSLEVFERLIDFGVPLLLAAAGLYLVYRGLNPRRPGGVRACPKCRYDMRGTQSLMCPECGFAAPSERAMVRGMVRRPVVMLGAVMVLPSVWVGVFLLLTVPGSAMSNQAITRATERAEAEAKREGVTVGFERLTSRLDAQNDPGIRLAQWAYFGLRGVTSLLTGSAAGGPDQWWEAAGADNKTDEPKLESPKVRRTLSGDPWCLSWGRYVIHQWMSPIRHYRRYSPRASVVIGVKVVGPGMKERPQERVPGTVAQMLLGMPMIHDAELRNIVVDDALVGALAKMPRLTTLTLADCEVGDAQLAGLQGNGGINWVSLELTRAPTSEMFLALGDWPGLTNLSISGPKFEDWKIRDDAFAKLVSAPKLSALHLNGRVRLGRADLSAGALKKRPVTMGPGVVFVFEPKDLSPLVEEVFIRGTMATERVGEGGVRGVE